MAFHNSWDIGYIDTKEELELAEERGRIEKLPVFCYVTNQKSKEIIYFHEGIWRLWLWEKTLSEYTFDVKLNKPRAAGFYNIESEKIKELKLKIN